jgi:hypothetical protein
MNLAMWTGYALWTPAIFWLGRNFRFDRRGWKTAIAIHVPASLLITATHLVFVALLRYYLQGLRGGTPDLWTTIGDAFFRTVDQVLPVYWALIGLQHAVDYYRQARAREVRSARLETRLMESQLQALQQQLHPHFLFNTLHAISTLVHRDPEKADAMIERLSDLLRISLRKVGAQEVELAEELEYLRAYLDIEQVHFGNRPARRISHRRSRTGRDGADADPAAARRERDSPRPRADGAAGHVDDRSAGRRRHALAPRQRRWGGVAEELDAA